MFAFVALNRDEGVSDREVNQPLLRRSGPGRDRVVPSRAVLISFLL